MTEEIPEYRFERVTGSNIKDLSRIFKESRGLNIPARLLKRKYATSFTGHEYLGYFLYDRENNPAAFYGIFPCFVKMAGIKTLAAQTGDVITHKNHQRKGLFVKVAKKTAELAKAEGIELLWGIPNENSLPGFLKNLDWVQTDELRLYEWTEKGLPLYNGFQKLKIRAAYVVWRKIICLVYPGNPQKFIGSIMPAGKDCVWRDGDFNSYKSFTGNFFIQYKGLNIWAKAENLLYIGDLENPLNFTPEKVLTILRKFCRLMGLNGIHFEVSPDSSWDKSFSSIATSITGGPVCYYPISEASKSLRLQHTSGDIDIF